MLRMPRLKCIVLLVLYIVMPNSYAIDYATLKIGSITTKDWQLDDVAISLVGINQAAQKLSLAIKTLKLPKPLDDVKFVNINCAVFVWQANEIVCKKGHAKIQSKYWQSPEADFVFGIKGDSSNLALTNMSLAKGTVSMQAKMINKVWQLDINAKKIDSQQLKKLLPTLPIQLKDGKATIKLLASGESANIKQVNLATTLTQIQMQIESGQFATEKLAVTSQLKAENKQGVWQWQNHSRFNKGAVYVDPVYVEVANKPIIIDAQGTWNVSKKHINVQAFNYQHPEVATLKGSGLVSYGKNPQLEKADLSVKSLRLNDLFTVYVKPFFDPATVEGITLEGNAKAQVAITEQALAAAALDFDKLMIKDTEHHIGVKQGSGAIKWASSPAVLNSSHLTWQQLSLFNIPIGASKLFLSGWSNNIRLAYPSHLPILGGKIEVNQFSWQSKKQEEPDISFSGHIDDISLEKLSQVLHWTPLTGKISGHIPRVDYHDKTLSLGGELSINVFGGNIKVTNLASSKLFSDFPIVYSDFELSNLDLDQITRKFEFGNITGRLSGYVKKLTLENWRPTVFFAWLGTPDNDDSSHRISQKAVNNIASIGGGGATDILSRSFLSMFETFGYDKIGIGCYLNNGVCQMMGVATAPQGYYLIKGGGLPRIDVLGYNPQVDWDVLMERLSRISTADEVIVK
jgi:hypothetical protein